MNYKRPAIYLLGIFCLTTFCAQAQTNIQSFAVKLDSVASRIMENIPEIPGMSIAIVIDGKKLLTKGYGWANKEAGIKANANTPFYIASSTKSFTALAAALLDKERKIRLNAPMLQYFPNIKFANNVPVDKITIKELLTHTAGLDNEALSFRMAYSGDVNNRELLDVLAHNTTTNKSYGVFNYDNLGYNIYTLAIQQYLGKEWQDILQEKIFTPLIMKRTTAYMSKVDKNNWHEAKPYTAYGKNGLTRLYLEKKDNTMQSAGGLVSTADDLAIWLEAQIGKGLVNNKQVIPADVFETCQQGYIATERVVQPFTGKSVYGLGWYIGNYNSEKIIYHLGAFPGYYSLVSFMPNKKIGVAVLVNETLIGSSAGNFLATYAYDLWLHPEGTSELYNNKFLSFLETHANNKKRIAKSRVERAKRQSQLSLPVENYTGKYHNAYFGDVEVYIQDNVLTLKMGNLYAVSTPFTKPESIRVELVPESGSVITFKKNNNGKIEKLVYDGLYFTKL